MSNIPFHTQSAAPSSQCSCMADLRLPSITSSRPGPYPQRLTTSPILPPTRLPPISSFDRPPVYHAPADLSHRCQLPTPQNPPAPQMASARAHPLHAHNATSLRGGASSSNALLQTQPSVEAHIRTLEVFARNRSGEEKGMAFLGVWHGLRETGLQSRESARSFIAKKLRPYPWFAGDKTVDEALLAVEQLQFVNLGLIARSHQECSQRYWNAKIGDISVKDFFLDEGRKIQMLTQARAQAQAKAKAPARR